MNKKFGIKFHKKIVKSVGIQYYHYSKLQANNSLAAQTAIFSFRPGKVDLQFIVKARMRVGGHFLLFIARTNLMKAI